jgi:hypothetical protein
MIVADPPALTAAFIAFYTGASVRIYAPQRSNDYLEMTDNPSLVQYNISGIVHIRHYLVNIDSTLCNIEIDRLTFLSLAWNSFKLPTYDLSGSAKAKAQ